MRFIYVYRKVEADLKANWKIYNNGFRAQSWWFSLKEVETLMEKEFHDIKVEAALVRGAQTVAEVVGANECRRGERRMRSWWKKEEEEEACVICNWSRYSCRIVRGTATVGEKNSVTTVGSHCPSRTRALPQVKGTYPRARRRLIR